MIPNKLRLHNLKSTYKEYEHYAPVTAFVAGFLWDNLTLTRIDLWLDNLILFTYLIIAGASIIAFNVYEAGFLRYRLVDRYASWLPLVIQFAFGGLFSGYVVFYSRSASFATSWPFILFLLVLFVGNELFRRRYVRLSFQLSIFFVAVFSFLIFYLPVVLRTMGDGIFILSGIASLAVIGLVIWLLWQLIPKGVTRARNMLIYSIGAIYLAFNAFYFTNILPPIPLSLKDIGIFHRVEIAGDGNFTVHDEKRPWYRAHEDTFHRAGNVPVYIYSAVFAPTDLRTKILHEWMYFDEERNDWIITDNISFSIIGGRDGGYRGYSRKQNVFPARWRVNVITERGQVLGRTSFKIVNTELAPVLETEIR
jgi:hypothetical protein